jgi:hypothetical protein
LVIDHPPSLAPPCSTEGRTEVASCDLATPDIICRRVGGGVSGWLRVNPVGDFPDVWKQDVVSRCRRPARTRHQKEFS